MFHTFVGYLHGRLNAENEEEKKKSSKVINKMQGLVSMMIMKKKQDVIQVNGKEKVHIEILGYLNVLLESIFSVNEWQKSNFLITNSCDLGHFSIHSAPPKKVVPTKIEL